MKHRAFMIVVFLVIFVPPHPGFGAEQDLLNLLDSYMQPGEEVAADRSAEPGVVKEDSFAGLLGKNLEADLRIRFVHYPDTPSRFVIDPDKKNNEAEALLRWSTWAGREPFSIHASGWFEGGTQKGTYHGISPVIKDDSRKRRYVELNELYLVRSGGNWDLTVGKKVFRNRIASIFAPADRYSSFDLTDPMDYKILGSWMASYDHFVGDSTFTFSVLPVFQPKKLPGLSSRWVDTGFEGGLPFTVHPGQRDELTRLMYFFWGLFVGENAGNEELRRVARRFLEPIQGKNVQLKEELPRSGLRDAGWFARVKHSTGSWDLFLSAYQGPGLYPVIRLDENGGALSLVKENPDVLNLAAGFSTTWRSFVFYSELLYSASINDKDDSYINGIAGVTYANQDLARSLGLNRLDLCVEYSREYVLSKQSAPSYIATSRYMRIGREDIFGVIRAGLTEDVAVYAGLNKTLWNKSRFYRLGVQYRLRPGLTLDLVNERFSGPFYSYYGRWNMNDRWFAVLNWKF